MGAALDAVINVWMQQDAGNYDGAAQWFHPDAEFTSRGEPIAGGLAEVRGYWSATRTSFPDLRRDVLDYVETADAIAVRVRASGTNTGPLTAAGNQQVPATGRAALWEGIDLIRLRDGKISAWHGMFDQLGLLVQLGLVQG
ncbi:MAG: ester cyclase [Actinomycetota bacterium]